MAHIRIDRPASALFRTILGFPDRVAKAVKARALDRRTLHALQQLSDHQLDDIGICRKPRRIRSDYLGREPRQEMEFDYYRLDM
ncbi:DUF1127 domain-containing protein [Mesorhizobium sp. 1M-11]|uniref:DUF1127 domain-containing protein n=1 Tax=Mesorhizobium sp. 1M-11 TaxID=1529006 RepID=UPI0006C768A6|nr:DUF1127 domain-containing protein [Mesorhizobium sp. 1M-11]